MCLHHDLQTFLAGREAPQPRVLVFTARRSRSDRQGFKGTLHVIKSQDGGYQVGGERHHTTSCQLPR